MANLERPFNQTSSRTKDELHGFVWKDRGDEHTSTLNAEPTTETSLEPPAEITQPARPPAPLPQSFKCEKCGAAFENEGASAVHIQTCKGTEVILEDDAAS